MQMLEGAVKAAPPNWPGIKSVSEKAPLSDASQRIHSLTGVWGTNN